MSINIDKEKFKDDFLKRLTFMFAETPQEASDEHKYLALGKVVKDYLSERWIKTNHLYTDKGVKQLYYFSMEFLLGKLLKNNLINLGIKDIATSALGELNINIEDLYRLEPDPALGNGGLGRLAACFMDSIASLGLPGHGCGIRFKHGLFNQKFENGYQKEIINNWLKEDFIWEMKKPEKSVLVSFGGTVTLTAGPGGVLSPKYFGDEKILAVPYDIPIAGANSDIVNTLRLFDAQMPDETIELSGSQKGDYQKYLDKKFNVEAISQILYPDDSSYDGKLLRLKQEYFFVSAGIQTIIKRFKKLNRPICEFHKFIAIHINDTHPSLAIPELMRILLDEEHLSWEEAWDITVKTMGYTNHTILSEALERWPYDMFRRTLPRIFMIVEEIDRRFNSLIISKYPNEYQDKFKTMSIIYNGEFRMANLAIIGSHSTNGVAKLHTKILMERELHDFYLLFPERFNNKTNGITPRRWLINANPKLFNFIERKIKKYPIDENNQFLNLLKFLNDENTLNELDKIKFENKLKVASYVKKYHNIDINPFSIFDIQVKRLHGYKRQLLNIFNIIFLYNKIKNNPELDIVPRTFFFGAKAAPGYILAKNIIKLINSVADKINNDNDINNKLKVIFLENYGVSTAELIIPAGDISEQISTASKEASGTGNMKFMMNGAVTIATLDGANVEIYEAVGKNNIIIFGLSSDEVMKLEREKTYNAKDTLNSSLELQKIISQLQDGTFCENKNEFDTIINHLLIENDPYFVLKDFSSYVEAQKSIEDLYRDKKLWLKISLTNIAHSGIFSSDNVIKKYADDIWNIKELNYEY